MKPICCPCCGNKNIELYEELVDNDPSIEPMLAKGERCGVSYDERKVGCYDWQHVVVGWQCSDGHLFFVKST